MPIGTEAHFECEPHFVNPDGETIGGKLICSPQGRWLRFSQYQDFICSPGKTISYILTMYFNHICSEI